MKRQKSILIVEDEPGIGEIIKELLDPIYEEVFYAPSATEAQELVRKQPFSLILSDIMMPGIPGDEFVAFLRSLGRIEPVIFITGNATREILFSAVRLGVSDVVEKPFEDSVLLQSIDRTLEIDKRRLALYENIFTGSNTKSETQKKMIDLIHVANSKK